MQTAFPSSPDENETREAEEELGINRGRGPPSGDPQYPQKVACSLPVLRDRESLPPGAFAFIPGRAQRGENAESSNTHVPSRSGTER